MRPVAIFTLLASILMLAGCVSSSRTAAPESWNIVEAQNEPTARHEAALVAFRDKLYLIGGRRINPVDVYDAAINSWTAKSASPIEIHHFQAVVYNDAIYIVGAMTGGWPREEPLDHVMIYHPDEDRFEYGPEIPVARRRGGAGVVVHDQKIYLVGGITNGHMDGYVPWFDEFDPATGQWSVLPDAPRARDHFQAVQIDKKLYVFAGRRSEYAKKLSFEQTVSAGDIYDFATKRWEPNDAARSIPVERAGNMAFAWKNLVIVGGGESGMQELAHDEVQAFDVLQNRWRNLPSLVRGRHGSGFAKIGNYLYTASGSGKRGGEPELTSLERMRLSDALLRAPFAE